MSNVSVDSVLVAKGLKFNLDSAFTIIKDPKEAVKFVSEIWHFLYSPKGDHRWLIRFTDDDQEFIVMFTGGEFKVHKSFRDK